jgi:hypothetical protein
LAHGLNVSQQILPIMKAGNPTKNFQFELGDEVPLYPRRASGRLRPVERTFSAGAVIHSQLRLRDSEQRGGPVQAILEGQNLLDTLPDRHPCFGPVPHIGPRIGQGRDQVAMMLASRP